MKEEDVRLCSLLDGRMEELVFAFSDMEWAYPDPARTLESIARCSEEAGMDWGTVRFVGERGRC